MVIRTPAEGEGIEPLGVTPAWFSRPVCHRDATFHDAKKSPIHHIEGFTDSRPSGRDLRFPTDTDSTVVFKFKTRDGGIRTHNLPLRDTIQSSPGKSNNAVHRLLYL